MPSNRRGQETRSRILDAARDAVSEHGVDVSLQQVADVAGISRMTIYRHFDTREQLLTTLVLRESNRLVDRLTEILAEEWRPWTQRLTDALVYVITTVKDAPHLNAIVTAANTAAAWPSIDVDNRLVEAAKAFFLPYFQRAEHDGVQLRAAPEDCLDWVLRVALLFMSVGSGIGDDRAALHREIEMFVIPSVVRT